MREASRSRKFQLLLTVTCMMHSIKSLRKSSGNRMLTRKTHQICKSRSRRALKQRRSDRLRRERWFNLPGLCPHFQAFYPIKRHSRMSQAIQMTMNQITNREHRATAKVINWHLMDKASKIEVRRRICLKIPKEWSIRRIMPAKGRYHRCKRHLRRRLLEIVVNND